MENLLFVIVIILCVILILLLGVVSYFLYRYLKLKESPSQSKTPTTEESLQDKMPKEVLEQVKAAKLLSNSLDGQFCVDHLEMPAKGICSISNDRYCELCITKERDVRIARKFLHLFLDTDWKESFFFNNALVGQEKIDELMRVKKELWSDNLIPVIAQKQFKINIETDNIETFTVVMTRDEDQGIIDNRLGFLKSEQ